MNQASSISLPLLAASRNYKSVAILATSKRLKFTQRPWGFYATVAASGMQCVYLPRCINSLGMQSKLSLAVSWLTERAQQITNLAKRRSQILGLNALPVDSPGAEKRRSKK